MILSTLRNKKMIIALALVFLFISTQGFPLNYVADWPQNPNADRPLLDETQEEGPLRKKAREYDAWNAKYHHPYYGGLVGVLFADDLYTKVQGYKGEGDSCIWTGTYLGSQALRYAVTKDPEAKANIIKSVKTLDGYLHVTGARGYIARYYAPQHSLIYKGDTWCANKDNCHKVTTGKYAGDFWEGSTTKDQYSGWFFGMSMAYDFLDDEEVKKMIRDDVMEVVDKLIEDKWIILDEKGNHHIISAGPRPTYIYQLSWLNIAYHMTGIEKYKKELQKRLTWFNYLEQEIATYSGYFNRYNQYYGNNLAHTAWYNLLRLGRVYYSPEAYKRLKEIFTTKVHRVVNLSHNPWFNAIYMTQGDYHKKPENDPYKTELLEDITAFRSAPNYEYGLPERDPSTYTLDPVTAWMKYFPKLREILSKVKLGGFKPQAAKAFPIQQQCFSDFLFQRNPFRIEACGWNNKRIVESGTDYLAAYWLSSYHGLLNKNQ